MGRAGGVQSGLIPFFNAICYDSDAKNTVISTVNKITQIQSTRAYDTPGSFTATCILADANVLALYKSSYIELWAGRQQYLTQTGGGGSGTNTIKAVNIGKVFLPGSLLLIQDSHPEAFRVTRVIEKDQVAIGPYGSGSIFLAGTTYSCGTGAFQWSHSGSTLQLGQSHIANGTIQQVTRNIDRGMLTDITFDDALIGLSYYRCLDMAASTSMGPPIYKHLGDILMGAYNPATKKRGDAPGYFGIMNPLWVFKWVDPDGSSWPGAGDSFETALETAQLNLQTLAQIYNFHYRLAEQNDDGTPCTVQKATVECGPFRDDSGLEIWGGLPAVQRLNSLAHADGAWFHSRNPDPLKSNAALAQRYGLALIDGPQYSDGMDNVWNLYWCVGAGQGNMAISLSNYWENEPDKDSRAVQWGPTAGVTLTGTWGSLTLPAPSTGRKYYILSDRRATWSGSSYYLVASQRWGQGPDDWEYGILKSESVVKYGVRENVYLHNNKKMKNASELLAGGAGAVEHDADPVATWVLPVKFPRTSPNTIPTRPRPGQKITVKYQGQVAAAQRDTNPSSSTYGQLIPGNTLTYLDFPGTTDPTRIKLLQTCVQIDEVWAATGYTASYTMGHGKWRRKHWQQAIAKQLEHTTASSSSTNSTGTTSGVFEGVPLILSQSPTAWLGSIGLTTDYKPAPPNNSIGINLAPGAIAVTNSNGRKTGDDLTIHFWCQIHGWDQYLDFFFGFPKPQWDTANNAPIKLSPVDTNGNPVNYGVFRLAMHGSGYRTGFHLFNSTSGLTLPRGTKHKKHQHIFEPDMYFVVISTSAHTHHAKVTAAKSLKHPHAGSWHDTGMEMTWWAGNAPNLGWRLQGGVLPGWVSKISGQGFH